VSPEILVIAITRISGDNPILLQSEPTFAQNGALSFTPTPYTHTHITHSLHSSPLGIDVSTFLSRRVLSHHKTAKAKGKTAKMKGKIPAAMMAPVSIRCVCVSVCVRVYVMNPCIFSKCLPPPGRRL